MYTNCLLRSSKEMSNSMDELLLSSLKSVEILLPPVLDIFVFS
jgi:hypothetical protein